MVTSRIVETGIIQSNHKDSSKTKRVTFLKREVMPYAKRKKKVLCMDAQRHAEYYGMQQTFDELYA